MKLSNASRYILFVLAVLAMSLGCVVNTRPRPQAPSIDDPEIGETIATTGSAALPTPGQPPQPPLQPLPPTNQPAVVIKRTPVGAPYLMTTVDIEARKSHSLQIVNTTEHFACIVSPTMTNGDPVFKLRRNAQQNLAPVPPGWRIPCAAVIVPNPSERTEIGPEANLATQYVGTFRITVILLDYDAVDPQVVRTVISDPLVFPFTHAKNAMCPEYKGSCMYVWPIRP